jgi:rieske iron-sulfur protein
MMSNRQIPRRAALSFGTTALIAPMRSMATSVDQAAWLPQVGDLLVVEATGRGSAIIGPGDLILGKPPLFAWAMEPNSRTIRNGSRNGQILLMRLSADDLTEAEAAFTADGIAAFSAICTHAGCAVAAWKPTERHLLCPCHGSVYDPAALGRVVAGPAPRPLPALKLRVDNGALTVAAEFSGRIGGFTGRTD